MVGFVYSIVGMKARQVLQWSHMLGVLAEYRNSGLGRDAEAGAARAGAGAGLRADRVDLRPAAGAERAPQLHQARGRRRGVPPQRLRRVDQRAAQAARPPTGWWPNGGSAAARRAAGGAGRAAAAAHRPSSTAPCRSTSPTPGGRGWPTPTVRLECDERRLLLEIPMGFTDMQREAPELALDWRMQTREIFESLLRAAATGWWTSSSTGRPDAAATCSPRLRPTPPPDDSG